MRRPRGTRDLFGEELAAIHRVEGVMRRMFERYGYSEVETPIFEHLELFTKKMGSNVIRQLYDFKDKSGRSLALRPELTAPVVRLYIERLRSEPKPLKLSYFGSCFRYEEPQARRWRQFSQSGVEIIGSTRPEADAEIMALADDVMRELGLGDRELRVGHIRMLREVLAHSGVKGDAQDPIMRAIDSKDEKRIEDELNRAGVKGRDREILITLIALRGGADILKKAEKLVGDLPKARVAVDNLREILGCLKPLGVGPLNVDFGIARGLEYYTDAVFEFYVDGVQVAGGGRYDELIELLGGEPCPAVGVGFGIDRIARAVSSRVKVGVERLDCMVLPAGKGVLSECLGIARELRAAGLSVDIDLMGRSLAKAIAYADARGAERAIIVGARDLAAGKVTVRDMRTGRQEQLALSELVAKLRG